MKELKFNLRYLFTRKELYIAFITVLLMNLLCNVFTISNGHELTGLLYPQIMEGAEGQSLLVRRTYFILLILIVFSIVCSMIFADTSWQDLNENTGILLHTRLNPKKNIIVRWLLSIVVTTLICFIGYMLGYLSLLPIFGSGYTFYEYRYPAYAMILLPEFFMRDILMEQPMLYMSLYSLLSSLMFGIISSISYSLSLFLKHKLSTYFSGFMVVMIWIVLFMILGLERYTSFFAFLENESMKSWMDCCIQLSVMLLISIIPLIVYLFKKEKRQINIKLNVYVIYIPILIMTILAKTSWRYIIFTDSNMADFLYKIVVFNSDHPLIDSNTLALYWMIPILYTLLLISKKSYFYMMNFKTRYIHRINGFKVCMIEHFKNVCLFSLCTLLIQALFIVSSVEIKFVIGWDIITFLFKYLLEMYFASLAILLIGIWIKNYTYALIIIVIILLLPLVGVKIFYIPIISLFVSYKINVVTIIGTIGLLVWIKSSYMKLDFLGGKDQ